MSKIGTFSIIDGVTAPEIISKIFDFVILDSEHGLENYIEQKHRYLSCSKKSDVYLRVPEISKVIIQRYFEIGIKNIMIPQVTSVEDVDNIVSYSFFPPIGTRGISPYSRQFGYSAENIENKKNSINSEIKLAILIEGKKGIDSLQNILKKHKNRLYMVYFGLFDFANSMNMKPELENDVIKDSIKKLVLLCHNFDIKVGTIATNKDNIKILQELDIDYIVYKNDTEILMDGLKNVIS